MPSSADITDTLPAGYSVVRLNRQNCKDLARLYFAVHGRTIDAGYFEKKYSTAYTGHEFTGLLVYAAGEPVAFNGLQPCFISFNDQKILAAQNIDIMTDPRHRLRGMFVAVSQQLFALCRQLGIHLLFGFPNQHSRHGAVNKLGWRMTEQLTRFSVPVKPFWLSLLLRKIKLLNPLYRKYRSSVLNNYKTTAKGISSSVLKDGFAGVLRNEDYLQWKTYNETMVLKTGNVHTWCSISHYLMIGDMENVTAENFTAVMDSLKKTARKLGLREIQFHASPSTSLHRIWEAQYTKNESYPVLFQDFSAAIPPEKIKFNFADIDIF